LAGGWADPARPRIGAKAGRGRNILTANVLEISVAVEVSDREEARGFDNGRFVSLVDLFPPAVSGQQLSTQGAWILGSSLEGDSRWLREP
jgi:hypothetical protein